MSSDLDLYCQNLRMNLEHKIERLDSILNHRCIGSRYKNIKKYRNELVIKLYNMVNSHNLYDNRLGEAMEDPTGQDEDAFYNQHGIEHSGGWQNCGGGYMDDGNGGYRENFGY